MAISSCPKCDNRYFEMAENAPAGSNFKLMYIQCSKCGAVVGVMDYYNIGSKTVELEKQIKELKSQNQTINNNLLNLVNFINQKLR